MTGVRVPSGAQEKLNEVFFRVKNVVVNVSECMTHDSCWIWKPVRALRSASLVLVPQAEAFIVTINAFRNILRAQYKNKLFQMINVNGKKIKIKTATFFFGLDQKLCIDVRLK